MLVTLDTPTDSPAYHAHRLAKKLLAFRNSDSIVTAATSKATSIASHIAAELELPHDRHYCKAVRHPGNPHKTIGSITAENVVLDNTTFTMPRDYIQHQIVMLQHAIHAEEHGDPYSCRNRNVIVLREEVNNPDEVIALIEQLRKEEAASIILATPLINRETLSVLEKQVSQIVYLEIQHHTGLWLNPCCF